MNTLLSPEEQETLCQFGLHSEPIPISHVEFIVQKQDSRTKSILADEVRTLIKENPYLTYALPGEIPAYSKALQAVLKVIEAKE